MRNVRQGGRRLVVVVAVWHVLAPGVRASAQVVINEILASNRFGIADDDRESSDWIELENVSGVMVSLANWALTDDGTDLRKWVFPEVFLDPGERLLVWCSGADRVRASPEYVADPSSPLPFFPSLVTADAVWRYLTGAPELPGPDPAWKLAEFDDTAWESGQPGIGFGVDALRTVLPEGASAVFLRHVFTVEDPRRLPSLVLSVDYDDGFVAYLNGELVASTGMRDEGEPTFASRARTARNARGTPSRFDLSAHLELLKPGENILAMVLLNLSPTSQDLAIFPELGHVPPVLHTNFRLDSARENLGLSSAQGELVDVVFVPEQTEDRSYGRFPDGSGPFYYMLRPTPRAENDSLVSPAPIDDRVNVTPEAGKYDVPIVVQLSAEIPFAGFAIRYTTDGSAPTFASPPYDGPISVSADRVVRAAGFIGEERVTPSVAKSYFLSSRALALELPFLSMAMKEDDFRAVHLTEGARGRLSEREGHLEIFAEGGRPAAALGFGLRLHGGAGRSGGLTIKKAYKAYFRGAYGQKKLRYPLIPDTDVTEFDKLVFRSNFNDAFRTGGGAAYIRDQLIRDVHEEMGATVSHGAWYNLFINGRYLGIYNVVERMDKEFLASYFPAEGTDWDVIKTGDDVLDGTRDAWLELRLFMSQNDLSDDAVYDQALAMIDVENFTSYMLLNIWAQNHDWPHNNWYAARPHRPGGRWIFLSWDAEFGIGRSPSGFQTDTLAHVLSQSGTQFTIILRALLRNRRYRDDLVDALDRHLDGPLSRENVSAHIERLRETIVLDMPYEAAVSGGNVATWEQNINAMRAFAQNRNPIVRRFFLTSPALGLAVITNVEPRRIEPEGEIDVRLDGQRLSAQTQIYFEDIPSPRVEFLSTRELVARVPFRIELDGRPRITAVDPVSGHSTMENLLVVSFVRPVPEAIEPASGSARGGDVVRIRGQGFTEGVRVEFAGVPAPQVVRLADGTELEVTTPPGDGPAEVLVVNTRPGDLPAATTLAFTFAGESAERFRRGDANGDGRINVIDALAVLYWAGGAAAGTSCEDALDGDDSGTIDLTDALVVLNYLFQPGAVAPRPPVTACGPDPTPDSLSCAAVDLCR